VKWKPLLLSEKQLNLLPQALKQVTGDKVDDLNNLTRKEVNDIRGRIYSALSKQKRTERIDIFNGNYGMFRGIAAASILVAVYGLIKTDLKSVEFWLPLIVSVLAIYRWHRFGVYYARELYWEALNAAEMTEQK